MPIYISIWRRCTAQLTLLLNKSINGVCSGSRDYRTTKCVIGYILHPLHAQVSGFRLMRSHDWSGGQVYPVKASTCPYMGDHVVERRSSDPKHAPYLDLLRSKVSWAVQERHIWAWAEQPAIWADCQVLKTACTQTGDRIQANEITRLITWSGVPSQGSNMPVYNMWCKITWLSGGNVTLRTLHYTWKC